MEENSTLDRIISLLNIGPINQSKLNLIIDKKFIEQEAAVVLKMKHGVAYYKHIIKHKPLNKDNTINSYIMWIYDVVDTIDLSRSTNITPSRISMPDIDVDVPITKRDQIIQYIKNKYGQDKVSQMITFNTLKGRGALKEVLRVYGNISFEEMNNITKHIPDESKIADELQEIRDDEGTASIIRWTLENNGDKLKDWCYIDEDNNLAGPLAKRFEQAIRIEGTKYHQSKHAAGVAIAATALESICPMIFDTKTEQNIAGIEMGDLESLGVIKFDILGIALLDKIMSVNSIINGGNHAI